MAFTDWASAFSNIVMAIKSLVNIYVRCTAPPHPPPGPTVAEVEALQRELEELKQRLTDMEQLRERLVGALRVLH